MNQMHGGLYRVARQAWPNIELPRAVFERHLATWKAVAHARAFAEDLFLACAAAHGDPVACSEVERIHMGGVAASLRRFARDEPTREALLQEVRDKLLVGPPPALLKYTGKTSLEAWIRLVAKRCAMDYLRKQAREARRLAALAEEPRSAPANADSQLDAGREHARFHEALAAVLGGLSPRDRTLLRLHYGSGVSVDALGKAYGVHRATAARWVARIRQDMFDAVRTHMREGRAMSDSDFADLARTMHKRVDLALSSWASSPG